MANDVDLTRYFMKLEAFKKEHPDEVIKFWKSEKEFDKMVERFKKKEKQIIRDAKKSHGTIESYIDEMSENLEHLSEKVDEMMNDSNS